MKRQKIFFIKMHSAEMISKDKLKLKEAVQNHQIIMQIKNLFHRNQKKFWHKNF